VGLRKFAAAQQVGRLKNRYHHKLAATLKCQRLVLAVVKDKVGAVVHKGLPEQRGKPSLDTLRKM
jgi:hypothetical protein